MAPLSTLAKLQSHASSSTATGQSFVNISRRSLLAVAVASVLAIVPKAENVARAEGAAAATARRRKQEEQKALSEQQRRAAERAAMRDRMGRYIR
eukprot:XP_001703424.1 hypothetical protein CHLREDRAFT_168915 [Chlamydomonas reinhardtii]